MAREISLEKIRRAREASFGEKLADGPRLFAQACEAMRAGLRILRPGITEEEIEADIWKRNYPQLEPSFPGSQTSPSPLD